jgi:hypothetical protein
MAVYAFNSPETSTDPGVETTITVKVIKGKLLYATVHFPQGTEYKLKLKLICDGHNVLPIYGSASEWVVLDGTTTVALIWWQNRRDQAELKLVIRNEHDSLTFAPGVIVNVIPPEELVA